MTQREFADKLFVTDSAVSKWERGLSYPDITLIRDICEILGVSEHELLTASEDVEARSAEKLAARYRRMARNCKLAQYIIYGGTAAVCLICDLAGGGGGLSWSLVMAASLLVAASVTLLPALAPEPQGRAVGRGGVHRLPAGALRRHLPGVRRTVVCPRGLLDAAGAGAVAAAVRAAASAAAAAALIPQGRNLPRREHAFAARAAGRGVPAHRRRAGF